MTPKEIAFYSKLFIIAGIYNIVWGLFSACYPQWLYDFCDLERLNQPQIFQCLAMVVGVYGLLYIEVGRRLHEGFAIIAVGLLGKVLGPIGWAYNVISGEWPLKSIILILTNDLIWWIPFTAYLIKLFPEWLASFGKRELP